MTQTLGAIIKRIRESEALVITPRIDQYLIEHPEGIVVPDEMQPLLQYLTGPSPNADRSARFGASGRTSCLRQQVFAFQGMPPLFRMDPQLQNIFNDGTWRHIRWQMMGLLAGVFVNEWWDVPNGKFGTVEQAPVEVKHKLPQYHTSVSLDGENTEEGFGFELKGHGWIGKVVEEGLPDKHMAQVHTYFVATGHDRFIYVAEDKRSNNWKEIIVRQERRWMIQVKDELNALSDAVEDQKLPAVLPACRAKKGPDYQGCPFRHQCVEQGGVWPEPGAWS